MAHDNWQIIGIKKKKDMPPNICLKIFAREFFFTSFSAAALEKYSSSCVCSHLTQNSVYTINIETTRPKCPSHGALRIQLLQMMFCLFVNTSIDVFIAQANLTLCFLLYLVCCSHHEEVLSFQSLSDTSEGEECIWIFVQ